MDLAKYEAMYGEAMVLKRALEGEGFDVLEEFVDDIRARISARDEIYTIRTQLDFLRGTMTHLGFVQ